MKVVRYLMLLAATLCLAASLAFAAPPSDADIASAKAKGMVWVNTESKVYHKDGRYYGKTKQGQFMSEADAQKSGARAAEREIGEKGAKSTKSAPVAAAPAAPAPAAAAKTTVAKTAPAATPAAAPSTATAAASTTTATSDEKTVTKRKRKKKATTEDDTVTTTTK